MGRSNQAQVLTATEAALTGEALVEVREKTHGNWAQQALMAQDLKHCLKVGGRYAGLPPQMNEALEMICVKMSRIINGDYAAIDHWDDIIGYAQLGKQSIAK